LANARHDGIGRVRRDPVENRATEVRTTKVFAVSILVWFLGTAAADRSAAVPLTREAEQGRPCFKRRAWPATRSGRATGSVPISRV
jgi:hypothetical protein